VAVPPHPPRRRQARSIANDKRIIEAVVERLDHGGWEETSPVQIAQQAGLTHPTVLDRYPSRAQAVVAAWKYLLAPPLLEALDACVGILAQDEELSGDDLGDVLAPFVHPGPELRAAIEVLLVARYEPRIALAVHDVLNERLEAWLAPRRGILSRTDAARHAFVLTLALGLLIETRRHLPDEIPDLRQELADVAAALSMPSAPVRLPAAQARHLLEPPTFDLDDPALESLLVATLREIGSHGFEGATLKTIAAEAGYTTGLIFRRYDSKLSLSLDATQRMLTNAERANEAFLASVAASSSLAVADATMTREFMRPELREMRTITFEQYRLSWHNEGMQESFRATQEEFARSLVEHEHGLSRQQALSRSFVSLARGAGIPLLADLYPPAAGLPFDVVTIPLYASKQAAARAS
jgi:AcrR family transcriptional regulator